METEISADVITNKDDEAQELDRWLRGYALLLLLYCFSETGFLCSFGASPGTCFVDQTSIELTEIRLPLSPECWD